MHAVFVRVIEFSRQGVLMFARMFCLANLFFAPHQAVSFNPSEVYRSLLALDSAVNAWG